MDQEKIGQRLRKKDSYSKTGCVPLMNINRVHHQIKIREVKQESKSVFE